MKRLSIIFSLILCAIISYGQPIPIPGVKPTSFPLKAVLDGSEELYTQRDINGINNRRFLVSQVADYIRLLNPHDSLITKGDSICIKGGNCIYLGTVLNFVDSLRISNDTLYYHKGTVWRPLVLPSSTDSIFYTGNGNDTLPLYTVLTTGNAAPGSPAVGATYWVGASPTGSWAGHAQDIATWTGSAWTFHDPINGDYMYNTNTGYTYQWRSPKWVQVSGIPILNNGNSLSGGVRIGTNNATALNFETGNTIKMVIQPGGSVKINNLASSNYPLIGAENDGTLKKIYLTSDFFIDIDSLRYVGSGVGGSIPISGLTSATANNTIDNGAYSQEWQWNTMISGGLKLSSSSTSNTNGAALFEINKSGIQGLNVASYGMKIVNTSAANKSTALLLLGANSHAGTAALQTGDLSTTATINGGADINIGNRGRLNFNNNGSPDGSAFIGGRSVAAGAYGAVEISSSYGTYMRSGLTGIVLQENTGPLNAMLAIGYKNSTNSAIGFGCTNNNANNANYFNLQSTTPCIIERDLDVIKMSANSGITAFGNFAPTYQFAIKGSTDNVGIGTVTPVASAKLEVVSTTQGFLPPRMTAKQASAIASPAQGLMLFVTDTNGTFTSIGWWGYGTSWKLILAQ